MPFSSASGKNLIDRTIMRVTKQLPSTFFKQHRILDIGAGSGTYSDRYSKSLLNRSKFHWTGVEIWEPYVEKYGLNTKYDDLILTDAVDYLKAVKASDGFDITFLGDVVEHMTKERAIEMVSAALHVSQLVIISIPIWHYPQDAFEGNPYEAHVKDDWSHEEVMSTFPNIIFWGKEKEIGVYVLCNHDHSLVENVLKPQIGVYGICKNEVEFVKRCYGTIEHADFITICDTGSTDGTWEQLIKLVEHRIVEHGHEEDIEYYSLEPGSFWQVTDGALTVCKISVQPWRFDDARNVALSMMPEEIDMCVSIDMDELMEKGWKELLEEEILIDLQSEGRVKDRYIHKFSTIWNWKDVEASAGAIDPVFSEHWHERIHSRRGFRWKLPVHEVLVKGDGKTPETTKWLGGLMMLQKPDQSKSRSYYTPMIRKAIEEDPTRWKLYSFLASDLQNMGQYPEAIEALKKARDLADSDKAFISLQLSRIYSTMGNVDQSILELTSAVVLAPNIREYKVYLARLHAQSHHATEAKCFYDLAAAAQTTKTSGYHYDPACWDEAFEKERAAFGDPQ